jgi:hypothetical protein
MDINLLNGNVLRYKKESCSAASSFWVAQDARGRVWAFEVGERSEVGALESLSPQKNIKINNFNNFKPTTIAKHPIRPRGSSGTPPLVTTQRAHKENNT